MLPDFFATVIPCEDVAIISNSENHVLISFCITDDVVRHVMFELIDGKIVLTLDETERI